MLRRALILVVQLIGLIILLPLFFWSHLPIPEYESFTAPSQWLSFLPGYGGVILRRIWYKMTLKKCGSHLTVDWLTVIRTRATEIGDRCTLGIGNWVGWVRLGDDVMTGSHVALISGARQHDFSDLSRPMREQHGTKNQLVIENDVWIGASSVVMAQVNHGTVVGAGSIVTKSYPPCAIIAGNPARMIRYRTD